MSGRRKKEMGCLSSFIYLGFLIFAFLFLISVAGGVFVVLCVIAFSVLLIKGLVFVLSKICVLVKSNTHKDIKVKKVEKTHNIGNLDVFVKNRSKKDIIPEIKTTDIKNTYETQNDNAETSFVNYIKESKNSEPETKETIVKDTVKKSGESPIKEHSVSNANKPKPAIKQKPFDVERYAAMCNAYLEHEDEMEQYRDIIENQKEG